ncbi:MAG: hypothetical protein EOO36_10970 [Cytophagaceae bacterium]|nr:MAG: hypothetical protein EOO36_10970 [Cytophagaceae bacterium]
MKGEMEAAVRQVPFRAIHIFRPSLLLGARVTPRLGERVGGWLLALARPLLRGGWQKYRPSSAAAVARAMRQAAAEDGTGTCVHELRGE